MSPDVALRPVRLPADQEFLISVYASTRMTELRGLAWPQADLQEFIAMQFDAQTRHYATLYPSASHSVVTVAGEAAGRLIVDRSASKIHVLDIALLPHFRRAGIGTALMRELLEEADALGLTVRCHVAADNSARRFWEQLGLRAGQSDGVYVVMERPCPTSPR